MNGLLRYLELQARSKIGLSAGVAVWAIVVLLAAIVSLAFLIFAAFIWLAQRYDPLIAALVLCGVFLLITVIGLVACSLAHRRAITQARLALAARSAPPWLDPRLLGVGVHVARTVGWRRFVPLIAVGVLAAAIGREWLSQDPRPSSDEDEVLPDQPERYAETSLGYRAAARS